MASRTKQKEEARARRLAEEQARAERERRQRRMQMLGGVVLAALAVIGVAIAISSNGGGSSGLQKGSAQNKTVASVSQLLNGIPQSGNVLGNAGAPVTVDYYGDLQCPVCRDFTLNGGWPQLVQNEIRQGKVKVAYRAFETATRDPSTFQTQQVAALAAGKQNRFWNYTELFYHEQGAEGTGYVNETYLDGLAQQTPGLNVSEWRTARNDPALASQVTTDGAAGQAAGVSGTPTLIAKGPKGTVPVQSSTGVPSYSELQQAIKAAGG
jgi:protein-disulfide isomerase